MSPPTKTTPPSKPIHPLTPTQTTESPSISSSSAPPRRRSLRLANSEPALTTPEPTTARVSEPKKQKMDKSNLTASDSEPNPIPNGFVNLRSGKKILKREIVIDDNDSQNNTPKRNKIEVKNDEVESSGRRKLTREEKGKEPVVVADEKENENNEFGAESEGVVENIVEERNEVPNVVEQARNAINNVGEERGVRRNMERFRDIARVNASRFAHFVNDESADEDLVQGNGGEEERNEVEDWPGPFSTAMKIIRDREKKWIPFGSDTVQENLIDKIKWKPKTDLEKLGGKLTVPSLQELCIRILAKNVDGIVSLEGVPDGLRHRLSQLLCDSRRMNDHFFELLVGGSPTEIRVRDCSWLSEEHFTKCFEESDTSNLVVLQLDQCGRCLPDYVVVDTLARSPKQLPNLTSLSLGGACRLSDGGLRALVSSTPTLRSINLSQCSLLTSASLHILAESLKTLLKELYLDHCLGIDAALIVPALMELENLEVLSVAGIPTVCDTFVKDYIVARGHNMKELILKDCVNLTDASIKVVAEHCPGICRLDLMNVCKLTDLSMGYLTNGCRALHTLKLCRAAIKLRGPDALTNFLTPPLKKDIPVEPSTVKPEMKVVVDADVEGEASGLGNSGYDSGEEICVPLSSPTSVLNFRSNSGEEEQSEACEVFRDCQGETTTNLFDETASFFQQDMPCWDDVFNFRTPDFPTLFEEDSNKMMFEGNTTPFLFDEDLSESIVLADSLIDFEKACFPSPSSSSSTTSLCQVDDFFQDILLGSDPLVVL